MSFETSPSLFTNEPLPTQAYIPGKTPRPISSGFTGESVGGLSPDEWPSRWQQIEPFLRGVDLFNHGFYWEAHEAWEWAWRQAGRDSVCGKFLQGLIKLAALGVKILEEKEEGIPTLAAGAKNLFEDCKASAGREVLFGLNLSFLSSAASRLIHEPFPHATGNRVLNLTLRPFDENNLEIGGSTHG